MKSSPPLCWNPFWHANNCLDLAKYGYAPLSVSESCLLSASCGLSCYLTVRLMPHSQPHHSHILKNYSESFWNKNYTCKEFYYLRTWAFINLLISAYREFYFQAVKNTYFTLESYPLFLNTSNGNDRNLSIDDVWIVNLGPVFSHLCSDSEGKPHFATCW